jgi:hypothetical protein
LQACFLARAAANRSELFHQIEVCSGSLQPWDDRVRGAIFGGEQDDARWFHRRLAVRSDTSGGNAGDVLAMDLRFSDFGGPRKQFKTTARQMPGHNQSCARASTVSRLVMM